MRLLVDMKLSPRRVVVLGDARNNAAHWSMLGRGNAGARDQVRLRVIGDDIVATDFPA